MSDGREFGMAIKWETRHWGPDSPPNIVYTFQIELRDAPVRYPTYPMHICKVPSMY